MYRRLQPGLYKKLSLLNFTQGPSCILESNCMLILHFIFCHPDEYQDLVEPPFCVFVVLGPETSSECLTNCAVALHDNIHKTWRDLIKSGATSGIRTPDPRFTKAVL